MYLKCWRLTVTCLMSAIFKEVMGNYVNLGVCNHAKQMSIMNSGPKCSVMETVVDLRQYFTNMTDIVQIIPSHAVVNRCQGGCSTNFPFTCQASKSTKKSVDVMLTMDVWPYGEHSTVCTKIQVVEDRECECDCAVKSEDCNPRNQYYESNSCSCVCLDMKARNSCIQAGKMWDSNSCSCQCPPETWQPCSTGYVFDMTHSCKCVAVALRASEGLLAVVFIISVVLTFLFIKGYQMYRDKTGLFRKKKPVQPINWISVEQGEDRETDNLNKTASLEDPVCVKDIKEEVKNKTSL